MEDDDYIEKMVLDREKSLWFVGFMKQNSKDKDLSIKKLQLVKSP